MPLTGFPQAFDRAVDPLLLADLADLIDVAQEDAVEVAREWPADAIRLDAYEGAGGAGPFYRACGFTDRGENACRDTALHYYELLIS